LIEGAEVFLDEVGGAAADDGADAIGAACPGDPGEDGAGARIVDYDLDRVAHKEYPLYG